MVYTIEGEGRARAKRKAAVLARGASTKPSEHPNGPLCWALCESRGFAAGKPRREERRGRSPRGSTNSDKVGRGGGAQCRGEQSSVMVQLRLSQRPRVRSSTSADQRSLHGHRRHPIFGLPRGRMQVQPHHAFLQQQAETRLDARGSPAQLRRHFRGTDATLRARAERSGS